MLLFLPTHLEPAQPRQGLAIRVVEEVSVGAFLVHGVEGVVPDDVQALAGDRALRVFGQHAVQVLVVAPAHVHVRKPAPGGVHAARGGEARVFGVRVAGEEAVVDDARVVGAADRERVAHHCPLRVGAPPGVRQNLAQVDGERPRKRKPKPKTKRPQISRSINNLKKFHPIALMFPV